MLRERTQILGEGKNCAALTARAAKRLGRPGRAFGSFFQAEITLEKRRKEDNEMPEKQHASWGELLRNAVEKPGRMLEAYTAFHNYSILCLPQHSHENVNT